MSSQVLLMMVTAANKLEAENIGTALLEKKLIACCNIISEVSSLFRWKGELCKENEVIILLKTTQQHYDRLVNEIKKLHSYETPEIIGFPVLHGSEDYLNWVIDETESQ